MATGDPWGVIPLLPSRLATTAATRIIAAVASSQEVRTLEAAPGTRPARAASAEAAPGGGEELAWKPHSVRQGDSRGGWVRRAGGCGFLHRSGGQDTMPFGLAPV